MATLPAWASLADHQPEGFTPRINVDAGLMYAAWLKEFATLKLDPSAYPARVVEVRNTALKGGRYPTVDIPAMTADDACDPDRPTQYWLECAYQCMKLELQVAMRSFGFEIRVQDPGKVLAYAKFPEGRGIVAATWGKEARDHYRVLRGFIPA